MLKRKLQKGWLHQPRRVEATQEDTYLRNLYTGHEISLVTDFHAMQGREYLANVGRQSYQHLRTLAGHSHESHGVFTVCLCF